MSRVARRVEEQSLGERLDGRDSFRCGSWSES